MVLSASCRAMVVSISLLAGVFPFPSLPFSYPLVPFGFFSSPFLSLLSFLFLGRYSTLLLFLSLLLPYLVLLLFFFLSSFPVFFVKPCSVLWLPSIQLYFWDYCRRCVFFFPCMCFFPSSLHSPTRTKHSKQTREKRIKVSLIPWDAS